MRPTIIVAVCSSASSSSCESESDSESVHIYEPEEMSNNTTTSPSSTHDDDDDDVSQELSDEETTMLTPVLTVSDPSVLHCPVCARPLSVPVYQCENGHFSCQSCYKKKLKDKCPTCRKPLRNKRCNGMEMVLEAIKMSCKNLDFGCLEKLSYADKLKHESSCNYATMACPFSRCKYVCVVMRFYDHYVEKHPDSCKLIKFNYLNSITMEGEEPYLLLEEKEKILFFLHRVIDPLGSFVCVSTAANMNFSYDVTGGSGDKLVYMKSSVEITPKCFAKPAKDKCLLIPRSIQREANSGDSMLSFELSIRK